MAGLVAVVALVVFVVAPALQDTDDDGGKPDSTQSKPGKGGDKADDKTGGKEETKPSAGKGLKWEGTFNGTALPEPKTKGTITEWTEKDDSVTIRIDGMSYKEYIAYCETLEALSGWEASDDEDVAHFPKDYNDRTKVYCTGSYENLPHIGVQYYSDETCKKSGHPHFAMFVFSKW